MSKRNRPAGADYIGTCATTGKRQYDSRGHARKARQVHSHTRGTPYRCKHCNLFHIGRYRKEKTRSGYRQDGPNRISVDTLAQKLDVNPGTARLALKRLGIPITNNSVSRDDMEQIRPLTYRNE